MNSKFLSLDYASRKILRSKANQENKQDKLNRVDIKVRNADDEYIYHGTTKFIGLYKNTELSLNDTQKKMFNTESIADIFPEHYIINVRNFDDNAKGFVSKGNSTPLLQHSLIDGDKAVGRVDQ